MTGSIHRRVTGKLVKRSFDRAVGRRMVRAAEDWLRERGVAKLQLMIRETNTEVANFYERIGFEKIPRVVMSKWLKQPSS